MKHTDLSALFFGHQQEAWLAQFDNTSLFNQLLKLCTPAGLYIVDQQQRVLYWSDGAASLTGARPEDTMGQPCLPECRLTESDTNQAVPVRLSGADGTTVEATKVTQILYDKAGHFAVLGGFAFDIGTRHEHYKIDWIPFNSQRLVKPHSQRHNTNCRAKFRAE